MYSVYVVDDEPWALRLLESGLPWAEYQFQVVGRSRTVDKALDEIPQLRPNVLVTDIRIAGASGIEFIRRLRERGLDTTVIVVTGYADFDVAQTAIKLDVFDFLLKPLDLSEIGTLLLKLQNHEREKALREGEDRLSRLKSLSVGEYLDRERLPIASRTVRTITVRDVPPDFSEPLPFAGEHRIQTGSRRITWLLEQTPQLETELLRLLAPLRGRFPVGVSGPARESDPLLAPLHQAEMISHQPFLIGRNDVFFYAGSSYRKVVQLADELIQEGARVTAKALYDRWLKDAYHLENLAQLTTCLAQSIPLRAAASYTDLLGQYRDAQEMAALLVSCLRAGATPPPAVSDDRVWIHDRVVRLLQERFTQEVSLNEIARELNLSSSYLSEIFSKYEGVSFSKYLNQLRNARACELLAGTRLSVQEIAAMSGFHDSFYFSKQFKKIYGMTPMQYRAQKHPG